MTKATRDTTKLNFITDQGSTRATVRCACRALRFDDFFFGPLRGGAPVGAIPPIPPIPGPVGAVPVAAVSPVAVLPGPGPVVPGVRDVIALFTFVPARRKVRAGDDGEVGGGSGISQANAAGETVGVSCSGGEDPEDTGPTRSAGRAGRSASVASASAPRAPSWPEASV